MGTHNRISYRSKRAPIPIAASVVGMLLIADTPAAQGDFAGLIDIGGGRRIYLESRGTGTPTVVLEAGYRSSGRFWFPQAGASRTMVRPCPPAADRPGCCRRLSSTAPFRWHPKALHPRRTRWVATSSDLRQHILQ